MRSHDQSVGRKLRDEALAASPDFSPLLHARIMQQVQIQPAANSVASHWRIGLRTVSSIAAIALITFSVCFYAHRPTGHGQIDRTPVTITLHPSIPQLAIRFPNLSDQANSSLSKARFGYLDRDAKAAATYVINQFDIVPAPPTKRG